MFYGRKWTAHNDVYNLQINAGEALSAIRCKMVKVSNNQSGLLRAISCFKIPLFPCRHDGLEHNHDFHKKHRFAYARDKIVRTRATGHNEITQVMLSITQ